jgi:hypothetical protein
MSQKICSDEVLLKLYEEHKNLHQVARILNTYPTTISRRLKTMDIKKYPNKSGNEHPGWKGGINRHKGNGYIGIWNPEHERSDGGGYVF